MDRSTQSDGRSVIGTAFELLEHVGALEPVRLIDLAEVGLKEIFEAQRAVLQG